MTNQLNYSTWVLQYEYGVTSLCIHIETLSTVLHGVTRVFTVFSWAKIGRSLLLDTYIHLCPITHMPCVCVCVWTDHSTRPFGRFVQCVWPPTRHPKWISLDTTPKKYSHSQRTHEQRVSEPTLGRYWFCLTQGQEKGERDGKGTVWLRLTETETETETRGS